MCGRTSDGLAIRNGVAAAQKFARVTFYETTDEERARVRQGLEAYGSFNTMAMLDIVRTLTELPAPPGPEGQRHTRSH